MTPLPASPLAPEPSAATRRPPAGAALVDRAPPAPASDAPLAGRTVLQVIPTLETGGAERTTIDVAHALARAGARALVASEGGRMVAELQAKGGVWIDFPAAAKNPLAIASNIGRLRKLMLDEDVALVHARSRAPAWSALAACRLAGLPLVTTYHGTYSSRSKAKTLYNSVMARGDVVIANSAFTAEIVLARHPFAAERLRVIPRGLDVAQFSPDAVSHGRIAELRAAWGLGAEDRVVLLPARLTAWKGQRVLIEAARLLAEKGLAVGSGGVVFVLAGDPQGRDGYAADLDRRIAEARLEGVVRRVGHVEDMPAALMLAAVATSPSTEPEAFGRVAVEAQAMGVPVVVADHGAVGETVLAPPDVGAAERTGWRTPPGQATALAAALVEALSLSPSARDALARRAREHAASRFSVENMVAETLDAYAAALAARRPGS